MAALKFAPFASEIELPFYSALFASKLDHDKLSDSARPVLGLYEPRPGTAPDDSVRMQVLASALTSNQYVYVHISHIIVGFYSLMMSLLRS